VLFTKDTFHAATQRLQNPDAESSHQQCRQHPTRVQVAFATDAKHRILSLGSRILHNGCCTHPTKLYVQNNLYLTSQPLRSLFRLQAAAKFIRYCRVRSAIKQELPLGSKYPPWLSIGRWEKPLPRVYQLPGPVRRRKGYRLMPFSFLRVFLKYWYFDSIRVVKSLFTALGESRSATQCRCILLLTI